MDTLFDIAPLVAWVRVLLASLLVLFGMIAIGQGKVVSDGYGEAARGWLSPDRAAVWRRRALVLNATGLALWAAELSWSPILTGLLALVALAGFVMILMARMRA